MRVLRAYHAGRDSGHRARERALLAAGVDVVLAVPETWADAGSESRLSAEDFEIVELQVQRSGDVNRHRFSSEALQALVTRVAPDVVDVHEEPFSVAARQWLRAAGRITAVGYTAQNVDKRFPPPFAQYERRALARLDGVYACSRQAASVARGKGFGGHLQVLPLGVDVGAFRPGSQTALDEVAVMGLVGRLVPEKGVLDAVRVLAGVRQTRRARLVVVGTGPEERAARALSGTLGVADHVDFLPWQSPSAMASLYAQMHVVLVPSTPTATWVEQFGRVVVEGQASGAVVVGYASGSLPEVVGDAGVLVPPHDAAALTDAVLSLLATARDFDERRRTGLAAVADRDWRAVGERQAEFYDTCRRTGGLGRVVRRPREQAIREFGPPAVLAGGVRRPFALPLLREDNPVTRGLGQALDALQR